MNYQDIASRISTRNDRVRHERSTSSSAIVGTYQSRDPRTGLAKYVTADGGVGYARKISPSLLKQGDRIPALVSGAGQIGFADLRF